MAPGLREACMDAVRRLLRASPELIAVAGPAPQTLKWPPGSRLAPSVFAPALKGDGDPALPPSLGLGALLLDRAGYSGPRILQGVAEDAPATECADLGTAISESAERVALLAMGDGSARRSTSAPGYFDERAAAFDAETVRALREGDLNALLEISPVLARQLMATGRGAWQVLAGALSPRALVTDVLYSSAPFGVTYIAAYIEPQLAPGPGPGPGRVTCLSRHAANWDSSLTARITAP
jgi:hypothetical protein